MRLAGQDVQEMNREQRLLRQLVVLVRRCHGPLPVTVLDDLLTGRGPVRPVLPLQRHAPTP